jgi:hypothetical protein
MRSDVRNTAKRRVTGLVSLRATCFGRKLHTGREPVGADSVRDRSGNRPHGPRSRPEAAPTMLRPWLSFGRAISSPTGRSPCNRKSTAYDMGSGKAPRAIQNLERTCLDCFVATLLAMTPALVGPDLSGCSLFSGGEVSRQVWTYHSIERSPWPFPVPRAPFRKNQSTPAALAVCFGTDR